MAQLPLLSLKPTGRYHSTQAVYQDKREKIRLLQQKLRGQHDAKRLRRFLQSDRFGQLGLGSTVTVDSILVPTEVVFNKSSDRRSRPKCVGITTGGDVTFFTVEQSSTRGTTTDILACGMGQWGTLGNGSYSTAQGEPMRIKAVSGLVEYNEKTESVQSIVPYAISASEAPMGHVLLTLDTFERSSNEEGGRDLLAWGNGRDYQLGNGRRGSVATPTALERKPIDRVQGTTYTEFSGGAPSRIMLTKRHANVVKDMQGNILKKYSGADVEQCAVAGYGTSVVFWKVCKFV